MITVWLAEMAKVALTRPQGDFLKQFNLYQLEGRYPDTAQTPLDKDTSTTDLRQAEEFLQWLTSRL